jgi:hypothetical protein
MAVSMRTLGSFIFFIFFIFLGGHRDKNHDEVIYHAGWMSIDRKPCPVKGSTFPPSTARIILFFAHIVEATEAIAGPWETHPECFLGICEITVAVNYYSVHMILLVRLQRDSTVN